MSKKGAFFVYNILCYLVIVSGITIYEDNFDSGTLGSVWDVSNSDDVRIKTDSDCPNGGSNNCVQIKPASNWLRYNNIPGMLYENIKVGMKWKCKKFDNPFGSNIVVSQLFLERRAEGDRYVDILIII